MAEPTRWWRVFASRSEGRRRESRRFAHRAPVTARCASWPDFLELVTGDISAGGLYVETDRAAELGEAIELRLELPDGSRLALEGQVVSIRGGIGVAIEPPAGDDAVRFAELLAVAREHQVRPEAPAADRVDLAEPRPARPLKLSAVHRALGPDLLERIDADEVSGVHDLAELEILTSAPPAPPPSPAPRRSPAAGPIIAIDLGSSWLSVSTVDGDRVRMINGGRIASGAELDPAGRLARAREAAERDLGEPVGRAVVSVPVDVDDAAIDRLREAGRNAGLEIEAVIDEPTAAVLANRFAHELDGLVGVYDLGGDRFDFSVIDAGGGDLELLATAGDRELGGQRFDAILARAAAEQFARDRRIDLRQQPAEWRALVAACERAKRELSSAETATIAVADVARDASGPLDLAVSVNRALFERACGHLISRTLEISEEALARLGRRPADLVAIVCSGGATYIPAVRRRLAAAFEAPLLSAVPAELAVCLGAGIHAAQLSGRRGGTSTNSS